MKLAATNNSDRKGAFLVPRNLDEPVFCHSMHKNFLIITSMFVFEEPTTEMAKLDLLCFLFFEDFLKAITDISDIELTIKLTINY